MSASGYYAWVDRPPSKRFGLRSSMSGIGYCFDNAPMESFWGTLKQELVHHRHYGSRLEAVREITE